MGSFCWFLRCFVVISTFYKMEEWGKEWMPGSGECTTSHEWSSFAMFNPPFDVTFVYQSFGLNYIKQEKLFENIILDLLFCLKPSQDIVHWSKLSVCYQKQGFTFNLTRIGGHWNWLYSDFCLCQMVPHFDFNVFDRQVIHIASYTGEMLSAGPKQIYHKSYVGQYAWKSKRFLW